MHTDFVIQISPFRPEPVAIDVNGNGVDDSQIIIELQRWLRPGAEISLVSSGYHALTSILWLSGPLPDHTFRACVRLIAVSAPPAREPAYPTEVEVQGTISAPQMTSDIINTTY